VALGFPPITSEGVGPFKMWAAQAYLEDLPDKLILSLKLRIIPSFQWCI